jgi:hypothetical protein
VNLWDERFFSDIAVWEQTQVPNDLRKVETVAFVATFALRHAQAETAKTVCSESREA